MHSYGTCLVEKIMLRQPYIHTQTQIASLSNLICSLSSHAAHLWPQGPLSEPQSIGEHPINETISSSTFEKWLISCCSSPRVLSRLNLQLYPVSSTSKEATLHIHDHMGPYQSQILILWDLFPTVLSLCLTHYKQSPFFQRSLNLRLKNDGWFDRG